MVANFYAAKPGDRLQIENVAGTAVYPKGIFEAVIAEVFSEALLITGGPRSVFPDDSVVLCFKRSDGASYLDGAQILKILPEL